LKSEAFWPHGAALQLGRLPLYSAHISGARCGGRRRRVRRRDRGSFMLISPAFAQAASPFGGDSMLVSLLPFILIFVIMSGGLVGKVTKVIDDDHIEVEIADAVRVRQMRSMVADVRAKGEPVKEEGAAS
jgi:preprotein translocase subunit YajC